MIRYHCEKCNITTETSVCPICGGRAEVLSSDLYWCNDCGIPLYDEICPICGKKARRITTDLRPVFPEERLLLEILIGDPYKFKDNSVWNSSTNVYYVDGRKLDFSISKATKEADPDKIRKQLEKYGPKNNYDVFNAIIERWIAANRDRYDYITSEAIDYIKQISEGFDATSMFCSFSGGKDSTVVSDLVMRAHSDKQVLHLFGDTTLEFPMTYTYVERFKKAHPRIPVITAKNRDKDFFKLCDQIGPPSRVMRPCCTVFKTGAIQRKITSLFKNQTKILTFYGIRRSESASRNKYDRDSEGAKITKQMTVSPIIDWLDYDIWLYLLTTGIDFNDAYRLGFSRVGCIYCPNNSAWSETMSRIYIPEQSKKWHDYLVDFAKRLGKPDPEDYVNEGKWKARQGGNGLEFSKNGVVTFEPCVLQENTLNFELLRPISEELYELFKPFGYIHRELGNERLGEVYVTDKAGGLLLKLQGRIGTTTLKVSILNKAAGRCNSIKCVEDKVKGQIGKWQMCIGCRACESVCKMNAIDIVTDAEWLKNYHIRDDRCVRCGECILHFDNGCYLKKVIRTQKGK